MTRLQKLVPFICILFFGIFVTSCKNETEITPEITLAKDSISFANTTSNGTLAIKSNLSWTATSSQSWCTISPSSGEAGTQQLTLTVSENTTGDIRNAVVTIKVGSVSKQVKVMQKFTNGLQIKQKEYNMLDVVGEIAVTIETSNYIATPLQDWIVLKSTSTDAKTQTFTIAENNSPVHRLGLIVYKSGSETDTVKIKQPGKALSIPADNTGMASTSKILAAKMYAGWNLGNSMEVPGNETGWGNAKASQQLIDSIKAAGINAVRIPCAWDSYIENTTTFKIKSSWLSRVKEVVDYCYKNNMYVILNIHWDGGWLENNPTYAKQVAVNAKQKALWEQIAYFFRNYDEHLLFAGTNEVHFDYNTPSAENIAVQLTYNQTFVDAVRSTGGRNYYRNLVIQSYNTDIDNAINKLKIATDVVPNRLMVEVHYYNPWDFCGQEANGISLWGIPYKSLGTVSTWGQTKGIP
jgi:endoglucanase